MNVSTFTFPSQNHRLFAQRSSSGHLFKRKDRQTVIKTKKSSFRPRSLRTTDAFPVVASFPRKSSYFSEGEKRRPEMRLLFAGYRPRGLATLWPTVMGVVASVRFLFVCLLGIFSNLTHNKVYKSASQRPLVEAE